jgi:hypothetical protein
MNTLKTKNFDGRIKNIHYNKMLLDLLYYSYEFALNRISNAIEIMVL